MCVCEREGGHVKTQKDFLKSILFVKIVIRWGNKIEHPLFIAHTQVRNSRSKASVGGSVCIHKETTKLVNISFQLCHIQVGF